MNPSSGLSGDKAQWLMNSSTSGKWVMYHPVTNSLDYWVICYYTYLSHFQLGSM